MSNLLVPWIYKWSACKFCNKKEACWCKTNRQQTSLCRKIWTTSSFSITIWWQKFADQSATNSNDVLFPCSFVFFIWFLFFLFYSLYCVEFAIAPSSYFHFCFHNMPKKTRKSKNQKINDRFQKFIVDFNIQTQI